MSDVPLIGQAIHDADPILKSLGYTGPATIAVMIAAGAKYLYGKRNPSMTSEKALRDDMNERIDKLDEKITELYKRIEEISAHRDREVYRADGWYWLTHHARRVAEALVHDHQLAPLPPWPPDPDVTRAPR